MRIFKRDNHLCITAGSHITWARSPNHESKIRFSNLGFMAETAEGARDAFRWRHRNSFWLLLFSRVSHLHFCSAGCTLESNANCFCVWSLRKLLRLFSLLHREKIYRPLSVEMIGCNKSRLHNVVSQNVLFFPALKYQFCIICSDRQNFRNIARNVNIALKEKQNKKK